MHLVGYLYEDYHDARSLEHKELIVSPLGIESRKVTPTQLQKTVIMSLRAVCDFLDTFFRRD